MMAWWKMALKGETWKMKCFLLKRRAVRDRTLIDTPEIQMCASSSAQNGGLQESEIIEIDKKANRKWN